MEYVVEITKEEIKGNKEIAQALLVAKSPFFVDTTIEVDEDNIRINCINPERTKTPMRISNFGMEDDATLLSPEKVASYSVAAIQSNFSGEVIDVRL